MNVPQPGSQIIKGIRIQSPGHGHYVLSHRRFLSALIMTVASPRFCRKWPCLSLPVVYRFRCQRGRIALAPWSALISLFFGILLGSVGMDDIYGVPRFSLAPGILETGINFVTVLMAIAMGSVGFNFPPKPKRAEIMRIRPKPNALGSKNLGLKTPFYGAGNWRVIGAIHTGSNRCFLSATEWKNKFQASEMFGTGVWEACCLERPSWIHRGADIPLLPLGIPGSGATRFDGSFPPPRGSAGPLLFTKTPEPYTDFVAC